MFWEDQRMAAKLQNTGWQICVGFCCDALTSNRRVEIVGLRRRFFRGLCKGNGGQRRPDACELEDFQIHNVSIHQGSSRQSAATSSAKRRTRTATPFDVARQVELSAGKSHQPNQRTNSGIAMKLVAATLRALPIKVANEAWSPRLLSTGLRKRSSSMTTGKSPSSTSNAVFQSGGPLPVRGLIGTQPGNDVASRINSSLSMKAVDSFSNSARSGAAIHASRCAAVSYRRSVVQ